MAIDLGKLRRLLVSGATMERAGKVLGLHRAEVWRLAQRHGIPHRRRAVAESEREAARKMLRAGARHEAVAKALGISLSTVGRIYRARPEVQYTDCEPYRCPTCGGSSVVRPCRVCRVRGEIDALGATWGLAAIRGFLEARIQHEAHFARPRTGAGRGRALLTVPAPGKLPCPDSRQSCGRSMHFC